MFSMKAWPSRNKPLTPFTVCRSCRLATLTAAVKNGQRRRNMEPEIIILFVMFYLLLEEWEVKPAGEEEERTLA